MYLIFTPSIEAVYQSISLKSSGLLQTNIINRKIYRLGIGKMFNFTNQLLQEHLGPKPNIIHNTPFLDEKYLVLVPNLLGLTKEVLTNMLSSTQKHLMLLQA
jgi:hypothetical protein